VILLGHDAAVSICSATSMAVIERDWLESTVDSQNDQPHATPEELTTVAYRLIVRFGR
jgi:hypothetical protein